MATAVAGGHEIQLPSWLTPDQVEAAQQAAAHLTTTADPTPVYTSTVQSYDVIERDDYFANSSFSSFNGSGYSIAILDTGADLDHSAFGTDSNSDGVADRIVFQQDFADADMNASDVNGHGTNVASIAAGIATGANLIILKVFPDVGTGSFAYVEQALQWITNNATPYNIVAVNMSLGDNGNYTTDQALYGINDELSFLRNIGVTSIAAAGNNYVGTAGVSYPAADANAIAVGATWDANVGGPFTWSTGARDNTTGVDRITSFSQRHATMLDVMAPGASITAAGLNNGSSTFNGTSQAAPHVTGAVAVAQHMKQQLQGGARLTQTELVNLFKDTGAAVFDGDDEDDNVTNTTATYRRLNVEAAGFKLFKPNAPDLTASSDSGPTSLTGYNTDNYTNVRRPTFTGFAPPGSQVWLYRSFVSTPIATTTADPVTGAYTMQVPSDLGQNTFEFWVRVAENSSVPEANKSAESLHLPVTIDFQRPQATITPIADHQTSPVASATISFINETSGTAESGIYNFAFADLRLIVNGSQNRLVDSGTLSPQSANTYWLSNLNVANGSGNYATDSPGLYFLVVADQSPALQDRAGNALSTVGPPETWTQTFTYTHTGQNLGVKVRTGGASGTVSVEGDVTAGTVELSADFFSITKSGAGTLVIDAISSPNVPANFAFNANEGTTTFTANPGSSSVRNWALNAAGTVNINVPAGHHWRAVTVGTNGALTNQAGTMVTGSLTLLNAAAAPTLSSGGTLVHNSSATNVSVSFTVGGVTFTGTANGVVYLVHDTSAPTATVRKFGSGVFTLTGISSKTAPINYRNEEGKTEFQTNVGDSSVSGSVNWSVAVNEMPGSPASSVEFQTNQNLVSLEIGDGAVATISTSTSSNFKVLTVGSLSIAQDGTLDVTNNGFVVDYASTLTTAEVAELEMMIRDLVLRGRASTGLNPTWTGTGITSSTAAGASQNSRAVGYAVNGSLPLGQKTTFLGQSVDSSTILVRFTVTCDFNLDGTVNDDDVAIYSTYYKPGLFRPYWAFGDADYTSYIDNDDGTLLGGYYGQSV
jgi:hypothetical protein